MNVTLVNPFDPVPGEPVREGRYAAFSGGLVRSGSHVTWLSSDWSHTLKLRRDSDAVGTGAKLKGYEIRLASARPYSANVSLARWLNHREIARRIPTLLETTFPRPDVVLVSIPPPNLAASVARWCSENKIPLVVDVQDVWPETFGRLLPSGFRWLNVLTGYTMRRDVRRAYSLSAAGLAVANYYAQHFEKFGGQGRECHRLHLGTNLMEFDRNVVPRSQMDQLLGCHSDKRIVFSGGSMGSALNWRFLLDVASVLRSHRRTDLHVVIAGSGPEMSWVRGELSRRSLDNVTLLGQQPYSVFCSLAAGADIGVNHFRPDSYVAFPNRVFDYFAADLPVLNTIPGELSGLIACKEAGFTTTTFDVDAAVRFVEDRVASRPSVTARRPPRDRRGGWISEFDRPVIASHLPEILAEVVNKYRMCSGGGVQT